MTVKELKNRIRELTGQANNIIAEVRGREKNDTFFDKAVGRLQKISKVKGKNGYIGYGLSKSKVELEIQLAGLESFTEREWYSNKARRREEDRDHKAYEKFRKRYGYLSEDEWEDFVTMINGIKNYLQDFGYEDIGRSIARAYGESSQKSEFEWHLHEAIKRYKGGTPEDFIDTLNDILIEEGAIDEW